MSTRATEVRGGAWRTALSWLDRRQQLMLVAAVLLVGLSAILTVAQAGAVLTFIVSALALALLAAIVGEATGHLGTRLGPGATGVLQSALGNLPELFVGIFA